MRIAICDTYYSSCFKTIPFDAKGSYQGELSKALDFEFGTGDFFSYNLRQLGHETVDIIANHHALQQLWLKETGYEPASSPQQIVAEQLYRFKPDVVFLQDLSFHDKLALQRFKAQGWIVAGQCSCRLTHGSIISEVQCLFTSFPHYLDRFKFIGVPRVEYLPLAFEPRMLAEAQPERDLDIVFIGGVGESSYWIAGTMILERVAQEFCDRFHWYGYGQENLRPNSALRKAYRGEAWGREQYRLYSRAKIVINRHGEVSEGFSNNLRLYEASGMAALVMTEASANIHDLFPRGVLTYRSPDELCYLIAEYLFDAPAARLIANEGQAHTLGHHTYQHRMPIIAEVLEECLDYQRITTRR